MAPTTDATVGPFFNHVMPPTPANHHRVVGAMHHLAIELAEMANAHFKKNVGFARDRVSVVSRQSALPLATACCAMSVLSVRERGGFIADSTRRQAARLAGGDLGGQVPSKPSVLPRTLSSAPKLPFEGHAEQVTPLDSTVDATVDSRRLSSGSRAGKHAGQVHGAIMA